MLDSDFYFFRSQLGAGCVSSGFDDYTAELKMATTVDAARDKALQDYRKKLLEHKEVESRLKESKYSVNII